MFFEIITEQVTASSLVLLWPFVLLSIKSRNLFRVKILLLVDSRRKNMGTLHINRIGISNDAVLILRVLLACRIICDLVRA